MAFFNRRNTRQLQIQEKDKTIVELQEKLKCAKEESVRFSACSLLEHTACMRMYTLTAI